MPSEPLLHFETCPWLAVCVQSNFLLHLHQATSPSWDLLSLLSRTYKHGCVKNPSVPKFNVQTAPVNHLIGKQNEIVDLAKQLTCWSAGVLIPGRMVQLVRCRPLKAVPIWNRGGQYLRILFVLPYPFPPSPADCWENGWKGCKKGQSSDKAA